MVSRSGEGQLVALARGLFGDAGSELQLLMGEAWSAPAKLSLRGLEVLEDTLGKGAVLWLTRQGAWRDRLWSKRPPPAVFFESDTVAVLQWLLEQPLAHEGSTPLRLVQAKSLGCELVLLAALASSIDTPAERQLATQLSVRASPLCRVAFPITLALHAVPAKAKVEEPPPLAFDAAQDFALEALQPALARWWRDGERLKARLLLPADVLRCGTAQARALDQLFAWADQNERRERATFLLEALAPLLHERVKADDFVTQFDDRLSLRDRHAARRAAGAALRGLERLAHWDEQARTVRFIDDGYDAAQARVKTYETVFGNARFALAHRVREELDALPS
ncbi:MAG: hypothetical protein JNK82_28255 [Myxococcaceae bacterium]|nr:hypothetical protein [Myxococcaceae bacterium]